MHHEVTVEAWLPIDKENSSKEKITLSICDTSDFFIAQIKDPPSPYWYVRGLGRTEDAAISDLFKKINSKQVA